jgi:hypothetical protein
MPMSPDVARLERGRSARWVAGESARWIATRMSR